MWKYLQAFETIYGMDLHLLKYTNLNTISSLIYVISRVIIPYAHCKLKDRMAIEDWSSLSRYHVKRRLATLMEGAERVADAASLANWLGFVGGGRYANLSERMLGLRVGGSGSVTNINLEFTQRQLVWSVMTVGWSLQVVVEVLIIITGIYLQRLYKQEHADATQSTA